MRRQDRGRVLRIVRAVMLVWLAGTAGCKTYVLQGTVVQAEIAAMTLVDPGDARLAGPPLANVRISVERDPDKLAREMVGTSLSDTRGRFVIPLDQFGAGWMDEQWLIRAFKQGYETTSTQLRLNMYEDQRLLIMMPPGVSWKPSEDWREQYERFR